ncbi:MAG: helix-turn-helix domain-containing protein [Nitrospira sp.]|nr:helix-turn-helix domain-containing protein [Nitrospira sp.]MDE0486052.1 helix-turn-helix domain-containing protein [Nitrospira sp.]
MNTLPDRIRTARKEVGLSQADIAKALRISASAVNQWEQGSTKNMKLAHFFALANLLEKDPRWLATGYAPRWPGKLAQMQKPDQPPLTSEERALLHQMRRIPARLRKVLMLFLKGLGDVCVPPKKSFRRN